MWEIKETGFNQNQIIHLGNKYLTGHLKLGVRGTLDEYTKEQLVGVNLPLVYDQVGVGWRESVNAFNPFYTTLKVNGKDISILTDEPIEHEQILNLRNASMHRHTTFKADEATVTIDSERFISLTDERMMIGKYQVVTSEEMNLQITTGIDSDIWDINGPHIEDIVLKFDDFLYALGNTHEKKHKIKCIKKIKTDFDFNLCKPIIIEDKVVFNLSFHAVPGKTYTFFQYAIIGIDQTEDELTQRINCAMSQSYNNILGKHNDIWKQKWDDADVVIEGDKKAQLALRYSIYHLLLLSPKILENGSIPARGISGQTYKGAIFWDTEIFMLPFYLNTDLDSAMRIIGYRINTLNGAKEKAKSYGFSGAFYAWESQEDGFDACTDYNVTDVFTKRSIRTYFKDKQIHISGDVVYAIESYLYRTNDFDILKNGALEVILEVARFYLDYGHYSVLKNRFEIWDVMGPDEYHERVHNNAFTNQLVSMVFDTVMKYERLFTKNGDTYFYDLVQHLQFEEELKLIHSYANKVHVKEVLSDHLIEQFDGYFKMHDIEINELLKQKLHPNEYLGGTGLAGDTQIIKQADVITMLYLFKERFSHEDMKSNWEYYEPRTEHGSSLSASMYALIACFIGNPEYAYSLFMKSAAVDLTGESKQYAGGTYIGGTHPAASGGAYLTAIYGFSGLSIGDEIKLNPRLPESIDFMQYNIKHIDKEYQIKVYKESWEIKERTK